MDYAEEAFPEHGYSTLPVDPVQRAKLRISIAIAEQLLPAFYALVMKKEFDEGQMKTLREKLEKAENFLEANHKEGSNFSLGTENPTQLDIHFYVTLSRIEFLRGSVFHDLFWEQIQWEKYPRCNALVEAMRARPEFLDALANRVTH